MDSVDDGRARRHSLDDEIQYVKGVGPTLSQILKKIGIGTVGDVLRHIPRRYEDRTKFKQIIDLMPGESATIHGRVVVAENTGTSRRNFTITKVLVSDDSAVAQIVFFQQPYLLKTFEQMVKRQSNIVVFGQAKRSGYGPIEIERAEWEEIGEDADTLSANRIVPIYPATEGVSQKRLRRIADAVLATYLPFIEESLPADIIANHNLADRQTAFRNIHYPDSFEMLSIARRRLVFEEFFLLQAGLARRRAAHAHEVRGLRFNVEISRLNDNLKRFLPFELTGGQRRSIDDIVGDVTSGRAMNRLVQGDVGSGKTVVALAAMMLAVENGFQAALMAPTEILAQQHAIVLRKILEPTGIEVELSIGSQSAKVKAKVRSRMSNGDAHIVVGTHALIQEEVEFHRLGLVIIDEQHRFGVLQRQALHKKGDAPHVLVMTATPIPRTLTLTIYGDLDTSIINELPPGRKPIKTHWKHKAEASGVYAAVEKLIQQGRQAYIVCPLVEESDKLQVRAATQLAEHMRTEVFPHLRVGLLHGQMKTDDKEETMRQFKEHEIDILVATTVIEVGIDVPNASCIVVEDADRFGLAQLHQLRGRVGRGTHSSYCILLADPKTEDGMARMSVMTATQDGFRIAEEDLKLRGPGEFFGTRQSGLPEFFVGDLLLDMAVMDETRRSAFALVESDPNLARNENSVLRKALEQSRMGFELVRVS